MSRTPLDRGSGRDPAKKCTKTGVSFRSIPAAGHSLVTIAAILALGTLLAACGGDEPAAGGEPAEGQTLTIAGQEANDHGAKDVSGTSSVEFEMDDFYFEPTVLRGEGGQSLTLEAFNEGDAEHNITIEGQGVDKDLHAGDEAGIEITFPRSGTVVFFCEYHQDQGMRGALKVSR